MKGVSGLNTDYRRQRVSSQDRSTMRMQQIALRRHISIAQGQAFTPEEQLDAKMATHEDHLFLTHQHGGYGSLPVRHYHQTYADDIQDNISRNQEEGILPRSSKVIVYRDIFNFNHSNMDHQGEHLARVQRSVTFDLSMERALFVSRKEGPYKISKTKMSSTPGQKSKPSPGYRTSAHSRHSKIHKPRSQGNKLKVKLNLNPFRRSQVHPKSGSNQEHKDVKRTSKKIKKDKSQKSGSNQEDKDVKRTSKKIKKDKSRKTMVEKDSEGHESEEKSKKGKITEKSQCAESSPNPVETTPEESASLTQSSNLFTENTEALGTSNTTDPQVPTLDLNLAVSTPEDARSLQKDLHMPQGHLEDLPNDLMTPVSSTVSIVQEYLSSGDGSPKRKIRLIVPEKTSSRPQTALEKKIR